MTKRIEAKDPTFQSVYDLKICLTEKKETKDRLVLRSRLPVEEKLNYAYKAGDLFGYVCSRSLDN